MNELFKSGESVVNTLYAHMITQFSVSKLQSDPNYLDHYINYFKPIVRESVSSFKGGSGLFVTFDPALKNYTKPYEIWYAYHKNGQLRSIDANANGVYLEAFKDTDAPYMQFFFKSIKNKRYGVWTEIHYDPDIDREVFGYCRAVYQDDLLLGVIGTTISSTDLYKTANIHT